MDLQYDNIISSHISNLNLGLILAKSIKDENSDDDWVLL